MASLFSLSRYLSKHQEVVLFSSTAVALYGYDQGMMSLVNTNYDYLNTMGISEESPWVGVIVSVHYIGTAIGAGLGSWWANKKGRRIAIFTGLAGAVIGNILMFITGLGKVGSGMSPMIIGRLIMGIGIGALDVVVPVYSAELSPDGARGKALAQEFQANVLGLNLAFLINLVLTNTLGKSSQWAWRLPIIAMQVYPILMLLLSARLPETPRFLVLNGQNDRAKSALAKVFGDDDLDSKLDDLIAAHEEEEKEGKVSYADMLLPSGSQFHPTVVTVMGQINQMLTGYGAVSVYGPQIFELLGFGVMLAEYLTMGNYLFYLATMTIGWVLIDRLGRRLLLIWGSAILSGAFIILAILGYLAFHSSELGFTENVPAIPGVVVLVLATAAFGVTWLTPPWLIPTEIYPSSARAQGSAISVITWGVANFGVTFLTPIGFNGLKFWLFLIFAGTNAIAGLWTWIYLPESGGRSFEDNQEFFKSAEEAGSWRVKKVNGGEWLGMPGRKEDGEREPLLGN